MSSYMPTAMIQARYGPMRKEVLVRDILKGVKSKLGDQVARG
jgi:hypothetical protein